MDVLDGHLVNLFTILMRLGYFDPPDIQPFLNITFAAHVNTPDHQRLALQAAQEGIVLMKNDGSLPLKPTMRLAVIGPNANNSAVMQGNYNGRAPFLIPALVGIQSYATQVQYDYGCDISSNITDFFSAACSAAKQADAVVLVMGLNETMEDEGMDRTVITWPGVQPQLISLIASQCVSSSTVPVVLVIYSGGPVDISTELANARVNAVLWAGYPGQSGGQAVADVLFGAVSPSGRLDHTWYPAEFVSQVPLTDMGMRPNSSSGNPGRTYRFYTGTPVLPFGFGLSYTTFRMVIQNTSSLVRALQRSLNARALQRQLDSVRSRFELSPLGDVDVLVTNTGSVSSDVSVLLFLIGPNAGQDGNPISSLVSFGRVRSLAPGASELVHFPISADVFSYSSQVGQRTAIAGDWTLMCEQSLLTVTVRS